MRSRKPIIGLCGGIGAGKSLVAAAFGRFGCCVIASDELNRQVLSRPEVIEELQRWWGPGVLGPDGRVDRSQVARIAFGDPAERRRLESLTHPLIAQLRADMIAKAVEDSAVRAIILDSPLLFESSLDRQCDAVVFVDSPEDQRIGRLQRERGWDVKQLRDRERWQLPLEEKRRRSSYVIRNDGPPHDVDVQVLAILDGLTFGRPASQ